MNRPTSFLNFVTPEFQTAPEVLIYTHTFSLVENIEQVLSPTHNNIEKHEVEISGIRNEAWNKMKWITTHIWKKTGMSNF